MATPKQAYALVTYFGNQFKGKYGYELKTNRYTARWGFDSVLEDMSSEEAKALIDYYFTTASTNGHALEWFFRNYEKLQEAQERAAKDAADLARAREETRLRVEEWRRKRGDN